MRRILPLAALLVLTGCHRITGLQGPAGEARHGNGFHYLSIVTIWAGLFAVVAGIGFLVHSRLVRSGDSGELLWGSMLVVIGVVLFFGTSFSALGLWLCHGTC
jgi:heme/copper-type cytochrome/quinol oxidase subunit 2